MTRRLSRALVVLAAVFSAGCSTVSFSIANLPARFAPVRRTADVPFGSGLRDRMDIYQPRTPASDSLPVIIFWYGGGWTEGRKGLYRFVGATLARLGYVVILPDYRVYPEVRFPGFLEDAARAVAWVEMHAGEYGGDGHRIVLMGHSAGAHMAAMLALNHSYLRQAGADTHDIIGLIGLSGPYALAPNTKILNTIFSAPYSTRDWQVIPYAGADAPPTLLLHGGADQLVWPSNSEDLARALTGHGVRVELKIYAGRSHADTVGALSVPARRRAPVLADVTQFVRTLTTQNGRETQTGSKPAVLTAAP
jgi:acetyl esterase/lipase